MDRLKVLASGCGFRSDEGPQYEPPKGTNECQDGHASRGEAKGPKAKTNDVGRDFLWSKAPEVSDVKGHQH